MSIKYKDSNGTIEDIAGGLTADMAQTMIDEAVSHTGWNSATLNASYIDTSTSYINYTTVGDIVLFKGQFRFTTLPTAATELFSDIPKGLLGCFASILDSIGNTHGMIYMNNGEAVLKANNLSSVAATGTTYYVSGTYVKA